MVDVLATDPAADPVVAVDPVAMPVAVDPVALDFAGMSAPALLDAVGLDAGKWAAAFKQSAAKAGFMVDAPAAWVELWFSNALEQASNPAVQSASVTDLAPGDTVIAKRGSRDKHFEVLRAVDGGLFAVLDEGNVVRHFWGHELERTQKAPVRSGNSSA